MGSELSVGGRRGRWDQDGMRAGGGMGVFTRVGFFFGGANVGLAFLCLELEVFVVVEFFVVFNAHLRPFSRLSAQHFHPGQKIKKLSVSGIEPIGIGAFG